MTKKSLIDAIKGYSKGFLTYPRSLKNRIADLHEIEYAAQEAREHLEAVLDGLDEKRDPIAWGYWEGGHPYTSEREEYAERCSTCAITPLYTEQDVIRFRAGEK